jgi:hypothetical protein
MDKIEKISRLLLNYHGNAINEKIKKQFENIDMVGFLEYFFYNYPESTVHRSLIIFNDLLLDLSYHQWLSIIKTINNNELALYSFIAFTSRFLGIDFLNIYLNLHDVNGPVRLSVRKYFGEVRAGLLVPNKYDIIHMQSLNTSIIGFVEIHKKLLGEGAVSINKKLLWDF